MTVSRETIDLAIYPEHNLPVPFRNEAKFAGSPIAMVGGTLKADPLTGWPFGFLGRV